jgi:hypothetical protein
MIDCAALISRSTRVVWEDHLKLGLNFRTPESYENITEFLENTKSDNKSIFYCSPLVPTWIQGDQLDEAVRQAKPRDRFIQKAGQFIAENFEGRPYAGLHIRKTDYGRLVNEQLSLQVAVENPNVLFFVCSDSAENFLCGEADRGGLESTNC